MPWLRAPVARSANSNCTSLPRTGLPLMRYVLPLPRSNRRDTSSRSSLAYAVILASLLSIYRVTSAKLRAGLCDVPAKMTSSNSPPRIDFAEVSPINQRMASTILDLPQPLGPTIPVRPSSMVTSSGSAKDLKPVILRCVKAKRVSAFLYWDQA